MVETRPKAASLLDERCPCGKLLAKVSLDGVELLCRRCKRVHVIPWPGERREGSATQKSKMTVDR